MKLAEFPINQGAVGRTLTGNEVRKQGELSHCKNAKAKKASSCSEFLFQSGEGEREMAFPRPPRRKASLESRL